MMMNKELVQAAEDLLAAAKSFDGESPKQMALLGQVDRIRFMVESPMDTIFRQWDNIHLTAALDVLLSTGALQKIPSEGTTEANELAKAANVDISVIQRSMRLLVVQGIASEPSPGTYAHNTKSLAYVSGTSHHFFKVTQDQGFAFAKLPQYFQEHTKDDLFDLKKSPYAYAHGLEGMSYYEVISHDPARLEMFNQSLMQMEESLPVLGMFPFASLKKQVEAEPGRPFIVDVGGGGGRVLVNILQEAPGGFGAKVILQDRQEVLDSIPEEKIPGITKMEHDFFTPQPVKNAHLYLFRRILHDFYEPICVKLVKHVASAMGPSSRLLIGDFIVPDKASEGDDRMVYQLDFSMMILSGKEKTAKQFESILEEAGLEPVKIWRAPVGAQAILEAKLKD